MPDHVSNTTRLLAAAAYDGSIRPWLLSWTREPNRAVPPEAGVDLSLVLRVARFSEERERRYNYLFAALLAAILALVAIGMGPVALFVVAVATALWFHKDSERRSTLIDVFGRGKYSPASVEASCVAPIDARAQSAIPLDRSNLTVYSGFSPFVGAGIDMGGWSLAIATDKPKQEFGAMPPTRFEVRALDQSLRAALDGLQIQGLEQLDHFFVHGSDVRECEGLLQDSCGRPTQVIDGALAERYRYGDDTRVRHYRWIRVHDWDQDLIVSYFVRCSLRGATLFVEFKHCLLTPLAEKVREIDGLARGTVTETLVVLFLAAPIAATFKLMSAPFAVAGYISQAWDEATGKSARERRKLIDRTPRYDYGAHTSVRQAWSSGNYESYFQRADSDYYDKTLQKRLLDALTEFLDAHGVDTSDLRDRQSTILNNGVIVQGGNIEAGSLAVGTRARAIRGGVAKTVNRARQRTERGAA